MALSPTPPSWPRSSWLVFAMLASCLLMSCASLLAPRQIELPLDRLQASLDHRLTGKRETLEMFDVQLLQPRLTLLPDSGRIAIALNVIVSPPFLSKSWNGSLTMSGRVALDSARGVVLLREVRFDQLALDGLDEALQRQLAKLGSVIVDRTFVDLPLYTFRGDDLRLAGVQFVPANLAVRSTGIVVTLEPAR